MYCTLTLISTKGSRVPSCTSIVFSALTMLICSNTYSRLRSSSRLITSHPPPPTNVFLTLGWRKHRSLALPHRKEVEYTLVLYRASAKFLNCQRAEVSVHDYWYVQVLHFHWQHRPYAYMRITFLITILFLCINHRHSVQQCVSSWAGEKYPVCHSWWPSGVHWLFCSQEV